MDRAAHQATKRTNSILTKYGTGEGYNPVDVNAKELFTALLDFYTRHSSSVGHTITDKDGALYIDGAFKARFASKDTLNKRLAKAIITGPDYEGMILGRQENDYV
jgi:hypothetical protein